MLVPGLLASLLPGTRAKFADLQFSCRNFRRATRPPKATQTLQFHVDHCVDWYCDIIIQPSLTCAENIDKSKAMEFCTLCITHRTTMLSTTIKSSTIKRYLVAEASISLNHKQLHLTSSESS